MLRKYIAKIKHRLRSQIQALVGIGTYAYTLIVVGLLVQLFVFGAVRVTALSRSERATTQAFVQISDPDSSHGDALLTEQALLEDTEPLFFPTNQSTASAGQGPTLPTSAQIFANYPEQLTINPATLDPASSLNRTAPVDLLGLLQSKYIQPFSQLNSSQVSPTISTPEAIHYTINSLSTNKYITGDLQLELLPETQRRQLWAPAQFGLTTRSGSIVGDSFIVQSSGVESIDMVLQATLSSPHFCASLTDGYHLITFCP